MKILSEELTTEALHEAFAQLPPGTKPVYGNNAVTVEVSGMRFEGRGPTWPEAIRDALIKALTFHLAHREHIDLSPPRHPFQIAA